MRRGVDKRKKGGEDMLSEGEREEMVSEGWVGVRVAKLGHKDLFGSQLTYKHITYLHFMSTKCIKVRPFATLLPSSQMSLRGLWRRRPFSLQICAVSTAHSRKKGKNGLIIVAT